MAIHNRLTQTLGIEHPVLLAPMDLVSGGRLAAAVSHAGGLGLLGGGYGAKRRIVEAEGGQTVRSIVFDLSRRIQWPVPYTGRLLRNRHADTWLGARERIGSQDGRGCLRVRGRSRTR